MSSEIEVTPFLRGFIFATYPLSPPPTYVEGPVLENFYLHPWTNVDGTSDEGIFVVTIGHLVPTNSELLGRPVDRLLVALCKSRVAFFEALSDYGGRHAVIFGNTGDYNVVNDASAMQTVFYSSGGGVISSHPLLVERALGGEVRKNDLPFRYGYPGNRTPYSRTKILTANTYYSINQNCVKRFWPTAPLALKTVDEAAVKLLRDSTFALQQMAGGRSVHLTLTAGLDSRTLLAIALNSDIKFSCYTYGDGADTKIDRQVASHLADKYDVRHTVVADRANSSMLDGRINEAHYSLHHSRWVGALSNHFNDPEAISVLGNLLEIGRLNHGPSRTKGKPPPTTAFAMSRNQYVLMGKAVKDAIEDFGYDKFCAISEVCFRSFIDETQFNLGGYPLDAFDQFYWEHRMFTWQGYSMGERDFYSVPFIPFNSRSIFEAMLGVPSKLRHSDAIAYRTIELVNPSLLDIPINPKAWPLRK